MNALLHIALINAISATALAMLAGGASWAFRRPPLTRALWLLVLLKLVIPPVWSVPLWNAAVLNQPPTHFEVTSAAATDSEELDSSDAEASPAPGLLMTPATIVQQSLLGHWREALLIVWCAGSCLYAAAIVFGTLRLRRLVQMSKLVPIGIVRRLHALAQAMQMNRVPQVRFIDRPLPPMLCALGASPRILLPEALWRHLDQRQQDAVLVHELAHLRRCDHWVRALELLVCVLYWWHPVVWWARRELREANEQCCDAWVVWTMPRLAKCYAAALIETIDYISSAPAGLPALASGFGQFTNLRRRLVMIKQGNVMRSLTRPALAAVLGAAGLVLPLSPSLGQAVAPPTPDAPVIVAVPSVQAPVVALAPTAPVAVDVAPAVKAVTREEDDSDDQGNKNKDRADLQKARAEIRSLQAQLRAAERRLAQMERTNQRAQSRQNNREPQALPPALAPEYRMKDGPLPATSSYRPAAKDFSAASDEAFARASEKLRAAGQQLNDARDRTRQTVERRLDQMERQLTNMVDQLRQMKRQLGDQPGAEPLRK